MRTKLINMFDFTDTGEILLTEKQKDAYESALLRVATSIKLGSQGSSVQPFYDEVIDLKAWGFEDKYYKAYLTARQIAACNKVTLWSDPLDFVGSTDLEQLKQSVKSIINDPSNQIYLTAALANHTFPKSRADALIALPDDHAQEVLENYFIKQSSSPDIFANPKKFVKSLGDVSAIATGLAVFESEMGILAVGGAAAGAGVVAGIAASTGAIAGLGTLAYAGIEYLVSTEPMGKAEAMAINSSRTASQEGRKQLLKRGESGAYSLEGLTCLAQRLQEGSSDEKFNRVMIAIDSSLGSGDFLANLKNSIRPEDMTAENKEWIECFSKLNNKRLEREQLAAEVKADVESLKKASLQHGKAAQQLAISQLAIIKMLKVQEKLQEREKEQQRDAEKEKIINDAIHHGIFQLGGVISRIGQLSHNQDIQKIGVFVQLATNASKLMDNLKKCIEIGKGAAIDPAMGLIELGMQFGQLFIKQGPSEFEQLAEMLGNMMDEIKRNFSELFKGQKMIYEAVSLVYSEVVNMRAEQKQLMADLRSLVCEATTLLFDVQYIGLKSQFDGLADHRVTISDDMSITATTLSHNMRRYIQEIFPHAILNGAVGARNNDDIQLLIANSEERLSLAMTAELLAPYDAEIQSEGLMELSLWMDATEVYLRFIEMISIPSDQTVSARSFQDCLSAMQESGIKMLSFVNRLRSNPQTFNAMLTNYQNCLLKIEELIDDHYVKFLADRANAGIFGAAAVNTPIKNFLPNDNQDLNERFEELDRIIFSIRRMFDLADIPADNVLEHMLTSDKIKASNAVIPPKPSGRIHVHVEGGYEARPDEFTRCCGIRVDVAKRQYYKYGIGRLAQNHGRNAYQAHADIDAREGTSEPVNLPKYHLPFVPNPNAQTHEELLVYLTREFAQIANGHGVINPDDYLSLDTLPKNLSVLGFGIFERYIIVLLTKLALAQKKVSLSQGLTLVPNADLSERALLDFLNETPTVNLTALVDKPNGGYQIARFTHASIPGNVDGSAFAALGISREDFANALGAKAADENVRQLFTNEIKSLLFSKKLPWTHEFIQHIEQIKKAQAGDQHQQALSDFHRYLSSETVFREYLRAVQHDNIPIFNHALLAYAKLQSISLYIWQGSFDQPLKPMDVHISPDAKGTKHLYFDSKDYMLLNAEYHEYKGSALHHAVLNGDTQGEQDVIEMTAYSKINPNNGAKYPKGVALEHDNLGVYPADLPIPPSKIYDLAYGKRRKKIQLRVDPNSIETDPVLPAWTPLHRARYLADIHRIRWLIDNGARVRKARTYFKLDDASQDLYDYPHTIRSNPLNTKDPCYAAKLADYKSKVAEIDKLINPDYIDERGRTPLHNAVYEANIKRVQWLLDNHAKIVKIKYPNTDKKYPDPAYPHELKYQHETEGYRERRNQCNMLVIAAMDRDDKKQNTQTLGLSHSTFFRLPPPAVPSPKGLVLQKIRGDGHCFYNSILPHLPPSTTVKEIRGMAAGCLRYDEGKKSEIQAILDGQNPPRTFEAYIHNVEFGNEWADNFTIAVVMEYLKRPIIIIDLEGKVREKFAIDLYPGDPIFVRFTPGHNDNGHYDAFCLAPNTTAEQVLADLGLQRQAVVEAERQQQQEFF